VRRLGWTPRVVAVLALSGAAVAGVASTAGAASLPGAPTGAPSGGSSPAAAVTSGSGSLPVVGSAVDSLLVPPATAAPAPATAAPAETAAAGPSLAVNPNADLTDGETVTVTASGMHPNAYGSVLECNLANNEPTVQVEGNAVPVGCTNPLQTITSTDSSGGFSKSFTIRTGTIGPPAQGTDSAGNPASSDAAKYPCPPTPAQQAEGTTCDMVYGDTSNDQATTPLHFAASASSATPASVAAGGGTLGATSGAGAGVTAASGSGAAGGGSGPGGSGSLAFTGAGPGLRWLAVAGFLLLVAGLLLAAAAGAGRTMLGDAAWRRRRRRPLTGRGASS
jgi:hypothetical protein